MDYEIEFDQEEDGRWIAAIESLPNFAVYGYGESKDEAESRVMTMAREIIAERD